MGAYKNVMEILVEEEVARQLKALPPRMSSYINQVELVAYALNQLPSLYATSEKGLGYQLERGKSKFSQQIYQAVQRALAAIRRDPLRTYTPIQTQQSPEMRGVLHQLRLLLRNDKLDWEHLPVAVREAMGQPDPRQPLYPTQQPLYPTQQPTQQSHRRPPGIYTRQTPARPAASLPKTRFGDESTSAAEGVPKTSFGYNDAPEHQVQSPSPSNISDRPLVPKTSFGDDFENDYRPPKTSFGDDLDTSYQVPKTSFGDDLDASYQVPKTSFGDDDDTPPPPATPPWKKATLTRAAGSSETVQPVYPSSPSQRPADKKYAAMRRYQPSTPDTATNSDAYGWDDPFYRD
jgi:hypothetical protein